MFNFSAISNDAILGKLLRSFLKIIPNGATVRILQGPLRGDKWIKGSGVNGYWLGTHEKGEQDDFAAKLKEGDVVFDIGANVGFYSLLAAKKVGKNGRVFAFEALPRNYVYLKRHAEMN